ncbi:MAG: lysophospholipid acyltransferase family protein [Ardenticatenaceae bacterium]
MCNIDAQGLEHTPTEGPLLLAANHTSIYEGPLIFAIVPRQPISPMAKMEYKDTILGKVVFNPINTIFVARGEVDRKALKEMIKRLKNNEALGMAPEGTRSPSGTLMKAKEGAAYMALKTDAWILPIAVWGQENVISEFKRLRRPTIHLRAGKPFKLQKDPNKTRNQNIEAGTERIMHAIARLLPPKYRGYYADAVQDEP